MPTLTGRDPRQGGERCSGTSHNFVYSALAVRSSRGRRSNTASTIIRTIISPSLHIAPGGRRLSAAGKRCRRPARLNAFGKLCRGRRPTLRGRCVSSHAQNRQRKLMPPTRRHCCGRPRELGRIQWTSNLAVPLRRARRQGGSPDGANKPNMSGRFHADRVSAALECPPRSRCRDKQHWRWAMKTIERVRGSYGAAGVASQAAQCRPTMCVRLMRSR